MRKVLKGTSILLSVTLVIGVISIAFSPLVAYAETFSNVSEFPDFDMDCYVADLFTTEGHSLNKGIELELNSESTNKIMKNSIESNSLLMGSMTAWQVATFEASDVTSDSVTELGYYESIILSSINTAMKSSRVKDIFDNAVIKDGKMLFSSFKDILKTEYYITDFSLKTYWSLSEENQSAYIKSFGEAFKKQYPKLDKTSDALKIFSTVVKAAKSFEECMNNYAAYAFCSLTNKHLTKVINDLYVRCPKEKVTLKAALLNISSACTSIELDLGADALDAIYRGADIVFGVLTDGLVTKIISAHPAGLAIMLGRAVGKTVSNILFSTDAICENYYKMCCFDEFEKLVRSVTRYEMGTYTKNKTNDNANNMFWAIRLMYNINEVGCDLSIDYAKTIYEKSVAGIFLDKTEYENFKKSVEFIRNCKQSDYSSLMTSYVFYLEEDYPEIYAAYKKLIDEIENPVVHATGISFSKKHMTLGLADDAWFFWNNAEVTPSNATNRAVSYSSSDESILSIKPGNTLMIELHQTGTVTITATSEDGGFTDQLTINVVEGHGTDGIHLEDPVTNITKSGKCGDIVYYNLYNDGMLKIYGNGPMWAYDYNNKDNRAPWENLSVKQVVIENGVTSIGRCAFSYRKITSVAIPNSVTSIGSYAFYGCESLTSVIIPNSVTSIDYRAFYGCTGLTSITIPDSVTSIGCCAFEGCTGLTSVTIPNSVTNIGDCAFGGCTGLTSITIPDSVTSIGEDAFSGCTGLTNVTIPDSVTFIGEWAFNNCTGLTSVTIPDSVKSIGSYAFNNCTGLTSVTIPDSVTSINRAAFYGCESIISITVSPDNPVYNSQNNCNAIIETKTNTLIIGCKSTVIPDSVTSIGSHAFYECEGLTNITIPNSVTSIGDNAFDCCTGLTSVTIPDSVTSIGSDAFGGCTSLTSVTIGNSVTSISEDAFYGCRGLTSVTIPDSVTSIGEDAFYGCRGLTSVTIPDSVTSIGNEAFENCESLTSVTIPDSVTSIGNSVFEDCTGLTNVTIPNSVTSIGWGAFLGCTGLTSVTIPDSVTSIGNYAFNCCTGLTSVTIGNGVTSIDTYAFYGCTGLKSITIPDSVTSIGERAFYGCTGLTSVTIGNGVTSIGGGAFENCTGLTSVTIPDSVKSIGSYAFYGCTGLTSVTIPESVTSIGRCAFYGCTGLTSVTIPNSVTSIGNSAFGYYTKDIFETKKIDNFTIYGSKGSAAEAYANENGFKFIEMSNFIEKTDKQSNVSVTMTTDLDLNVKEVTQSNTVKSIVLQTGESVINAYDITMLKNGKKTQPDGSVTVKIPCDNSKAKVYRVESDKTLTDMNAVYQDGFMVFTTNHFSVYVVTEPKTVLIGDVNNDGKVNGADAGLLNRYTSGWDGYAEKIKNMDAADINRDGKVNGADSGLLNRYTSGWENVKKYFAA